MHHDEVEASPYRPSSSRCRRPCWRRSSNAARISRPSQDPVACMISKKVFGPGCEDVLESSRLRKPNARPVPFALSSDKRPVSAANASGQRRFVDFGHGWRVIASRGHLLRFPCSSLRKPLINRAKHRLPALVHHLDADPIAKSQERRDSLSVRQLLVRANFGDA
jgi:hypothetical protein